MLDSIFDENEVENELLFSKRLRDRNRYTNILAYKKSRVVLRKGVDLARDPASDYINACYVNSPFVKADPESKHVLGDRKIIASQGPLPETTDHFWQMIVENNVSLIVSTCRTWENGRAKCEPFWPGNSDDQVNIS